jgi:hypothetical protein
MGGRVVRKVIPLAETAVCHLRSATLPSHQKGERI